MKEIIYNQIRQITKEPFYIAVLVILVVGLWASILSGTEGLEKERQVDRQEELLADSFKNMRINLWDLESHLMLRKKVGELYFLGRGIRDNVANSVHMPDMKRNYLPSYLDSGERAGLFNPGNLQFDFVSVNSVLISLFAMVFGYSLISGEKERGTLRLLICSSYSRTKILVCKIVGAVILIIVIYTFAVVVALLYASLATAIPLANYLFEILILYVLGVGLILTYFLISVMISSMTTNSRASLIGCLSVWLMLNIIAPSLIIQGIEMYSTNISGVKTRNDISHIIGEEWNRREQEWMGRLNSLNLQEMDEVEKYQRPVNEETGIERKERTLLRVSNRILEDVKALASKNTLLNYISTVLPASIYSRASYNLCDTGVEDYLEFKREVVESFNYVKQYADQVREKNKDIRLSTRYRWDKSSGGKIKFSVIPAGGTPDLGTFRPIEKDKRSLEVKIPDILLAFSSYMIWISISLIVSFRAFSRYDVR